jgi:hypothetical protein
MKDEMNRVGPDRDEDVQHAIRFIRRRLGLLIVSNYVLALALTITVAAVFGNLVDYHATDPLMFGGCLAGAAALGFFFGWIARRRS